MQSLQQLFVHELQDMWAAENRLVETLDRLSREQTTPQVQRIFSTHLSETQTHVDRLQRIFDAIGVQPGTQYCQGIDGIVAEHDSFVRYRPDAEIHAVFDVSAGERVEHYEIAGYESLVRLANSLGMERAQQLLQASLGDERAQLSRLQNVARTTNLDRLAARGSRQRRTDQRAESQPQRQPQPTQYQ